MTELKEQIAQLVTAYGQEKVKHAAEQLLQATLKKPHAELTVLSPKEIQYTADQLDCAISEIGDRQKEKQEAYKNKGDLLKQKTQLETEIKLAEAAAFMNTQSDGKNPVGMIDGKPVTLSNDTMRDAYRRHHSSKQRTRLAEINAEIAVIDVDLQQKNEALHAAKDAAEAAKAKAGLQAALLKFYA